MLQKRQFCVQLRKFSTNWYTTKLQRPTYDLDYICNPENHKEIAGNIAIRKGIGDINLVGALKQKLDARPSTNSEDIEARFYEELAKIPNKTHPDVARNGETPVTLATHGTKPQFGDDDTPPLEFHEIAGKLKLARTQQLGHVAGAKSYYLLGDLALLEHALARYIIDTVRACGFELISVPDMLESDVIQRCGMHAGASARNQVYTLERTLHGDGVCMSGTAEMALAAFLAQKTLRALPLKLAAISRCYRAETSSLHKERGIYRVHEFTKIEMFVAAAPTDSDAQLDAILKIQTEAFSRLGVHFKALDMPAHELGAQAYRKYDIEAWMPGRGVYGEVSSCSNCLDYQSRRLGIRYRDGGRVGFVHTLNGTACAMPRMLIALVEAGQRLDSGTVRVPDVLRPYMGGRSVIGKQKRVPELKLIKR